MAALLVPRRRALVEVAWNLGDILMGPMALINLPFVIILGQPGYLLRGRLRRLARRPEPHFKAPRSA